MINDVGKLRSLREVASRGTITAAAEALGYTPSAVSQQLQSLETDVGVPVLERRGRNVVLTDAGRILVDRSADVIGAIERAEAAIAELHGEPVGPVRIGTLASTAGTILPVALRAVMAEFPGLEPEVVVDPLDQIVRDLRLGTIDVGVDQNYEFAPHADFDDLERTVLLREPLLLLSPADDPAHCVADAADRAWVASPAMSSCGRSTRSIAARSGVTPRVSFETDDQYTTVRLVSAGLAVAIVPSLAMQHQPRDLHVTPIDGTFRIISALVRPAARKRPAITAVVDALVAAAPQFAYPFDDNATRKTA